MPYTVPQREDLEAALSAAFNYDTLARPFRNQLGKRLDQVVAQEAFDVVIPKVIDWCEVHGYERALVRMMDEVAPANDQVIAFLDRHREFPPLLVHADRQKLAGLLESVLGSYVELRSFVLQTIGSNLDEITGAPVADDTPSIPYLQFLVRWADHFDRLEALIGNALTRFPAADAPELNKDAPGLLLKVLRRRPRGAGTDEDPLFACDLGGKFFINRQPLRDALRGFIGGPKPRVIAVDGPARSGKSHSLYYILYLSEKKCKYDAVSIDLKREAAATFKPNELVRSIVSQMGRNKSVADIPKKKDSSTEPRWVKDLADFVVGEIRSTQKMWVVVLDGFDAPNLETLTRELVKELVVRAVREPLVRVVLLQYSPDLLTPEASGRLEREAIGAISEDDLRQFLTRYAVAHGEEAPKPEVLNTIVEYVFEGIRTRGPDRNEEIAGRVEVFLQRQEQVV